MSFNILPQAWSSYLSTISSSDINVLNFGGDKGFVRKSVICSWVEIDNYLSTFPWTFSLTKWQSISKCFVLSWKIGFEAMWMALWELQYNTDNLLHLIPKSFKWYKSHYNSHVVVDKARYSTTEDGLEMVGCFFCLHDTSKFSRKKMKPVVDLLESKQPYRSTSTYPLICVLELIGNIIHLPGLCFKYRTTM